MKYSLLWILLVFYCINILIVMMEYYILFHKNRILSYLYVLDRSYCLSVITFIEDCLNNERQKLISILETKSLLAYSCIKLVSFVSFCTK